MFLAWNLGHPEIVAQRLGWPKTLVTQEGVLRRLMHDYCKLCGSPGYKRVMIPRSMNINRHCARGIRKDSCYKHSSCIVYSREPNSWGFYGKVVSKMNSIYGQMAYRGGLLYTKEFWAGIPHVKYNGRLYYNINQVMDKFEADFEFDVTAFYHSNGPYAPRIKDTAEYQNVRKNASKYIY